MTMKLIELALTRAISLNYYSSYQHWKIDWKSIHTAVDYYQLSWVEYVCARMNGDGKLTWKANDELQWVNLHLFVHRDYYFHWWAAIGMCPVAFLAGPMTRSLHFYCVTCRRRPPMLVFASFDRAGGNISLFRYCGCRRELFVKRAKQTQGYERYIVDAHKSDQNQDWISSLLWTHELLHELFPILEAAKRANWIENIGIDDRHCRNNMSLHHFHHRQFKLQFTFSACRHPWMTIYLRKLYWRKGGKLKS